MGEMMNPILRNILAVVAGLIIGSAVNMGLIMISGNVIPPPAGVDVTDMESLKSSMHLFEPKHFIFPFLAHAFGTLVGAFIAALIAVNHKIKMALAIGVFFLLGAIMNVFMLPSPVWFTILDIIGAYIPISWIGGILAEKIKTDK
jgi:hypothetical protein